MCPAMRFIHLKSRPLLSGDMNLEARQSLDRAAAAALLSIRQARPAKIQFVPHRLVGNYAEYRKLNAGGGRSFT